MDQHAERTNACNTCKHGLLIPENDGMSCLHRDVQHAVLKDPTGTFKEYETTGIIASVAERMGVTPVEGVEFFGWPVDFSPANLKTCNAYEEGEGETA